MTITERMAAWHRQRRVLLRVSRAAWRLEQAERERSWALASARAEGISIRALAVISPLTLPATIIEPALICAVTTAKHCSFSAARTSGRAGSMSLRS